jgi:hypothetical protein
MWCGCTVITVADKADKTALVLLMQQIRTVLTFSQK